MAPISLIMVFWSTNPFWISLFAFCFLKERVYLIEIVAIIICFIAVLIIARERYVESDQDDDDSRISDQETPKV